MNAPQERVQPITIGDPEVVRLRGWLHLIVDRALEKNSDTSIEMGQMAWKALTTSEKAQETTAYRQDK